VEALAGLLSAIEQSWIAAGLRSARYTYPVVNALHILALGGLVGAIAALDLRILGAGRRVPLAPLARYLAPFAAVCLALAVTTGLLLFSVRAREYATNPAFLLKLVLVGAATLQALAFSRSAAFARLRDGASPGARARLGAAASLLLWAAAVLAGRFIAFL